MAPPVVIPRTLLFPFKTKPSESWHGGHRYFGAPRAKGRLHAGNDVMFPVGTPIFAMADGIVMRAPYGFYEQTDAIEISHPDVKLLMRYGELKPGSTPDELCKVGALVKAGQKVGEVGQLIDDHGHYSNSHMLHLEIYTDFDRDSIKHPLTVRSAAGGKMQRRSDVTDPAPYLDAAAGVMHSHHKKHGH